MNDVLSEFNKLQLDCLEDAWVQAICYSEYLEFADIPPNYEITIKHIEITDVFRNIIKLIHQWLNEESEPIGQKAWAFLTRRIPHHKILALIGYFVSHGTKNVNSKKHRNNAILASRLYFKMLSIPGYRSHHIYHSQLFVHSLACLGFPKAMCDRDDTSGTKELTRQVNSVIKELSGFVYDLRSMFEELHLSPNDTSFEDILSNLVDITGGAIVNKLDVDKLELAKISGVIYEIIDILICDSNRKPDATAIKLLFKCLLPKLVAASTDTRNANNLVRASYVTYSGLLLSKYGKSALTGYTVLLEHLCYALDGLEKSEVRAARVSLVLGLMSLLPPKSYRCFIKWLIKLSETSRISHRHIAMEMLAKLLSNDPEETSLETNPSHGNENATTSKENPKGDEGAGDGIESMDVDEEEKNKMDIDPEVDKSEDLTSNKNNDEEEVCGGGGLLCARAHTVPLGAVLRALWERVHDASSSLRARAVHALAAAAAAPQPHVRAALAELNGTGEVSRLTAVGARCACDERAVVRRAAVTLLQRLLAQAPPPTSNDLEMLVGLCRDASILVRSAAINALAEMTVERPIDVMFDAFVLGPMHQLSDPETKVQEQVITLVQQLLIDRLKQHSALGCDDIIPWQFLSSITRNNMRRHLQKACALLSKKNNCISVRLIDMVSTHLGAGDSQRDLPCLVLLTSAARYVDYTDISFLFNYYYKLIRDEDNMDQAESDNRLMALTLELLQTWSQFATLEQRTTLREHLVRRVAEGNDDGCRIASATLAAQLDPTNLQWATELMQLAERSAVNGGDVEEWVRAADLSLVAPQPPSPALLQLFLTAINSILNQTSELGAAEAGAVVAGAGRLGLRSRAAAGSAAPALAALLPAAAAPLAPRVNALLVLTDICTRYTCIVEPLLGSVCGCLERDAPPELRRAAARSLTRLLLAGYLRLRTPLYYRYCALLADEDHDVREPAEYYVTCCLTTEAIYHHFVDCVLYYNKETSDGISFDARQLIYDVMLQRLSLVQKLNVQCRLARDVLQHAADVADDHHDQLPADLRAALLDTITLLCGPRMKLPKKPEKPGEDIDDLQVRVTANIVSHKMKRTVAEVLVPAVLRLYARLGAGGGQLAVYLVRIANDLLTDYRTEIEELIENDEELVGRVRHFQETIGQEASFGNSRNLVTTSAPPEPETPRAPRRRAPRPTRSPVRKRALRI